VSGLKSVRTGQPPSPVSFWVESWLYGHNLAEREKLALQIALERHQATEASQIKAREFHGNSGFHMTRRAIALIVVVSVVLLPILLPSIHIRLLRYDQKHLALGQHLRIHPLDRRGTPPRVISPVMNNIFITIIVMFFGNQIVKR